MVTEARSPSLKADNLSHVAVDSWVEHNPADRCNSAIPKNKCPAPVSEWTWAWITLTYNDTFFIVNNYSAILSFTLGTTTPFWTTRRACSIPAALTWPDLTSPRPYHGTGHWRITAPRSTATCSWRWWSRYWCGWCSTWTSWWHAAASVAQSAACRCRASTTRWVSPGHTERDDGLFMHHMNICMALLTILFWWTRELVLRSFEQLTRSPCSSF